MQQFNWDYWFQVFETVIQVEKITMAKFCKKHGLPYENAKKAFLARRKAKKKEKKWPKVSPRPAVQGKPSGNKPESFSFSIRIEIEFPKGG